MDMTTLIVAGVVVLAAVAGILVWQRQKSKTLQAKFGTEYGRTIDETGDRRKAEAELHAREKRISGLEIKPLDPADRLKFIDAWRQVQAQFVDDPKAAVAQADTLLGEIMNRRGYPVSDFEQRAADLSVDHPEVVENYRTGHDIALAHGRGEAGTEDLRRAMIHYRDLFEELVGEPAARGGDSTVNQENSHVRH